MKDQKYQELLESMDYAWDNDPDEPEFICVYHYGKRILRMYIEDAIQNMGRKRTMKIVHELDRCDYIKDWQKEKFEEVTDILKK